LSHPGFYNDNAARAYPLIPPLGVTPPEALADFGCVVGLDADYDDARDSVYLREIRRVGDTFEFDFRSSAPGLVEYTLVFRRTLDDREYTTEFAEAVLLDPLPGESSLVGEEDLIWEGFLVTGPLDTLAAVLPADGSLMEPEPALVEPALIQNLARGYVRSLNLANEDRTRARAPDGCSDQLPFDPEYDYRLLVNARGLVGPLRVREGYNCTLRQNLRDNSLTIAARSGAGAGEACVEVPLHPDETPPTGSRLLTGGPACDEVVTSINGLSTRALRLVPGLGVRIVPSTDDPHTLIVDFDMHDLTVCGGVEQVSEEPPDA
jgi:hypothetical protein